MESRTHPVWYIEESETRRMPLWGNVSETRDLIKAFVDYALTLDGYEKGESQVFCDRLFKAFGHAGYKEAKAILEDDYPVSSGVAISCL